MANHLIMVRDLPCPAGRRPSGQVHAAHWSTPFALPPPFLPTLEGIRAAPGVLVLLYHTAQAWYVRRTSPTCRAHTARSSGVDTPFARSADLALWPRSSNGQARPGGETVQPCRAGTGPRPTYRQLRRQADRVEVVDLLLPLSTVGRVAGRAPG